MDGAIVFGNNVPARFRSPGGALNPMAENVRGRREVCGPDDLKPLRCTRAVAAGIVKHVWMLKDLLTASNRLIIAAPEHRNTETEGKTDDHNLERQ